MINWISQNLIIWNSAGFTLSAFLTGAFIADITDFEHFSHADSLKKLVYLGVVVSMSAIIYFNFALFFQD